MAQQGTGSARLTLAKHGTAWQIMAQHGRSWQIMADNGIISTAVMFIVRNAQGISKCISKACAAGRQTYSLDEEVSIGCEVVAIQEMLQAGLRHPSESVTEAQEHVDVSAVVQPGAFSDILLLASG